MNYEKLEELLEEQIAGGTDSIVICGTTGEASTMTHEEHLSVIKYTCCLLYTSDSHGQDGDLHSGRSDPHEFY